MTRGTDIVKSIAIGNKYSVDCYSNKKKKDKELRYPLIARVFS